MDLQHVNAKIFVDGDLAVDPERFIEVFHRWIQEQEVEELLIDVADYRHVPDGPSVMLIGHEADYAVDNTDGQYGLLYNRKDELDGSNSDRLQQALAAAAGACERLEEELADDGPLLRFSRQRFEIVINDRALAPNTAETFAAVKPELESFLKERLGHSDFSIEHDAEPRRRFAVTVTVNQPFELAAWK